MSRNRAIRSSTSTRSSRTRRLRLPQRVDCTATADGLSSCQGHANEPRAGRRRAMDLSLLETLKEKLADATDFTDVWNYFFDHFGEDLEFIDAGDRAAHPFLSAIIAQIGIELFGRKVRVEDLLLTHLPDHAFYHGGFTI